MNDKYKKEKMEYTIQNNLSIAGVCRDLGIRPIGGNYRTIKYYINLYEIDTSHFTGQAWNVGTRYRQIKNPIPLSEILIENSTYTNTSSLKIRLVKEKLLKYKCDVCDIKEWNNKNLSLHLDHINGNNRDNRIENLRLLCPNCHSQTNTYCNKNTNSDRNNFRKEMYDIYKDTVPKIKHKNKKVKIKQNYCKCGKQINRRSKYCKNCYNINQRKIKRPVYDELLKDIKELNYTGTGKKYGVSDNTIRKWEKEYEKRNVSPLPDKQ